MPIPFVKVTFADGATVNPGNIHIHHKEFNHEVALFRVRDPSFSARRYQSAAPLTIEWGNFPNDIRTFHGYVNHIEPKMKSYGAAIDIVAIASSFVLNAPRMKTWSSIITAAEQIAQENRFTLDLESLKNMPMADASITQTGESDWHFLAREAKRRGLSFYAKDTHLVLRSRFKLLEERFAAAKTFFRNRSGFNTLRLRDFLPIFGLTDPDCKTVKREAYTIDMVTGTIVGIVDSIFESLDNRLVYPLPIFPKLEKVIAFSKDQLYQKIHALGLGEAMCYHGEARLDGATEVEPATPIVLEESGPKFDGGWTAINTEHVLEPGPTEGGSGAPQFETKVTVVRAEAEDPVLRPSGYVTVPKPRPTECEARLINGIWRAG